MNNIKWLDEHIDRALKEDVRNADITTEAIVKDTLTTGEATMFAKEPGIIAGLAVAERVFFHVDSSLAFTALLKDGHPVEDGKIPIAEIEGNPSSILTAERTALNFIQRMSGIATMANSYQKLISHTKAKVIDTRKTVPGLRQLDKLAVELGGCANHRVGLFDMFLIKDNHIQVAGSISLAVEACRAYNKRNEQNFRIEVETTNLDEVKEALDVGVDRIMLDNFDLSTMKQAVQLIDGACEIEASGGITKETIVPIAETGVDFISVGALTHSVRALDISLDLTIKPSASE